MDFADDGDLQDYLNNLSMKMKEFEILDMFAQIALSIKFIHDEKVMHRDIKATNIFRTSSGLLKLGDFGIAKVLENTTAKARTKVGSPCYIAPEVIIEENYNYSADIWSLGALLYQM